MKKTYYDLWDPFFGGIYHIDDWNSVALKDNPEMQERLRNRKDQRVDVSQPLSGPYLRYDYDLANGKDVKLLFPGKRSFVFNGVNGPIELIFADGRVETVTGNRINVPEPIRCPDERWRRWKEYRPGKIMDILTYENGIVVFEQGWADLNSSDYSIRAFKHGKLFARFNSLYEIEEDKSFFDRMMDSDDAEPFEKALEEKAKALRG